MIIIRIIRTNAMIRMFGEKERSIDPSVDPSSVFCNDRTGVVNAWRQIAGYFPVQTLRSGRTLKEVSQIVSGLPAIRREAALKRDFVFALVLFRLLWQRQTRNQPQQYKQATVLVGSSFPPYIYLYIYIVIQIYTSSRNYSILSESGLIHTLRGHFRDPVTIPPLPPYYCTIPSAFQQLHSI